MTRKRSGADAPGPFNWPGDPETMTAADIDFEALAHVLANTCRRGGCLRQYHSVAAHAVFVSEEIEAFDGLGDGDRRRLALHALVADTPSAWLRGAAPGSQRAMERTGRLASGIEAAVREAAGLDAVPDEEGAELLRFVTRMAAAAESRDLLDGNAPTGAGVAFPPLKRRIRPVPPDKAAQGWLARFRALAGGTARMPSKADMERNGSMWPVMVSAVLLSGAVATAAAALRFGVESVPEIASVRLGEMTAAYTTRAAAEGRTAEDVRASSMCSYEWLMLQCVSPASPGASTAAQCTRLEPG